MSYIIYYIIGGLLIIIGGLNHHIESILLGILIATIGLLDYKRKKHPEKYPEGNRPKSIINKHPRKKRGK